MRISDWSSDVCSSDLIGNAAMMAEESADPTGLAPVADSYRNEGATVMFLAVDGVLAGLIAVADPIKPTTADEIRRLHGEGLGVIVLTGDNRRTGEGEAAGLGIDVGIVDVLPQDRSVEHKSALQSLNRISDAAFCFRKKQEHRDIIHFIE